LSGPFP
jgi:programmed cell death 6-interacting protein